MTRYKGPKLRIIRRLGDLPGLCSKKSKKRNPPGQHGRRIKNPNTYTVRLFEKQKLRFNYGLGEKQLKNYIKKAKKNKRPTTQVLLELIEMRLDNILFRLGIFNSINATKQFISHRHIQINSHKISIPSYECKIRDEITLSNPKYDYLFNQINIKKLPSFLDFNPEKKCIIIKSVINRSDILLKINELLIIEYYAKN